MTADPTNPTDKKASDAAGEQASEAAASADQSIGYADAMTELDEILRELDDDDIDIDVLSERVERAAHLIAICRGRIGAAQERVAGIVAGLDDPAPVSEGK